MTTKNGSLGWLPDNLNQGRLDLYYVVLVILSVLNIFFFIIVAKLYKYKKVSKARRTSTMVWGLCMLSSGACWCLTAPITTRGSACTAAHHHIHLPMLSHSLNNWCDRPGAEACLEVATPRCRQHARDWSLCC